MPRLASQQFSFTRGILDYPLTARMDTRSYYAGALEILNMLGLPQGGLERRGGLEHIATLAASDLGYRPRMARFSNGSEKTYLIVFTDLEIHIYRVATLSKVATVESPFAAADLADLDWVQSYDTMILVHPDHQPRRLIRQSTHASWALNNVPLTSIPTRQFYDDNGDLLEAEPIWSASRGWPTTVRFQLGRLYFGGSRTLTNRVDGSGANQFFDFFVTPFADQGEGEPDIPYDDEAVSAILDGDEVAEIQAMFTLNNLFVMTTQGVHVAEEKPVTPSNFGPVLYPSPPCAKVRPVELESAICFVSLGVEEGGERRHQSVYEIFYDEARQSYEPQDLALLASKLMRDPVNIAARKGNETTAANHLYVVNRDDGSLAILNTRRSQEITAWTTAETLSGLFKDVAVVGGQAFFLVRREISGVASWRIERLSPSHLTDAAKIQSSETPTTSWNGLGHLDGATVWLIGDGRLLGQATVSGGAVETPAAVSTLEAGLGFPWAVAGMPVEGQLTDGTLVGNRHRVVRVTVQVEDTVEMKINGRPVPGLNPNFGGAVLDAPLTPRTGAFTSRQLGWSGGHKGQRASWRLTGSLPQKARVLGVTAQIAV